ncbi:ABC transporter permease [Methyloligella sp. 2.7D]|uniref:ABC transporter permease n=1 Tax=unclassified Methyloligella TaxID=2625955 RepID=UPI00157C6EC6|nr:ABC transporter permease [Methyloligella sp. GL2]QKP77928.1 ABC transporter permease [Methyloligella sp. GL2]
MRKGLWPTLYLFPASALFVLFFVLPLAAMIWMSFYQQQGFVLGTEATLANYLNFFSKPYYLQALWNSLWMGMVVTGISLLIAYPLAYILSFHASATWQRIGIMVCMLPFWTSYVVRSYSWLLALSNNGVVSQAADSIGFFPAVGLANTTAATIIGFVHFFVMLLSLTIFSSLVRIPRSYIRAAQDLGAGWPSVFTRIIWPLSLPGVIAGVMLTFVLTLGDYVTPQILGGGKELVLTQVIMLQVQRQGNFPMAGAINLVLMAISIAVTLIANRAISKASR